MAPSAPCCPGGPPYVYNTIPPATGTPIPDSLGNQCVAVTSRTFYQNIPATIQGAELEVQFAPIEGMIISAQYGYTDFQGDEFDDPALLGNPSVTDITSDNPIYVPTDNWSMSFAHKFNVGDSGIDHAAPRLLRPDRDLHRHPHQRVGHVSIDTTEAEACTKAYELLNARIEWASPEDTWRVALGATNLTDEEYFLNKFDLTAFGQPTLEGQPGAPREWYVQFTRNFN